MEAKKRIDYKALCEAPFDMDSEYDVNFKIEDQSAWDVYFTITSENTLLEKVLGDLEKIAPLRFEYKEAEKEVIVTRKKEDSRLMH